MRASFANTPTSVALFLALALSFCAPGSAQTVPAAEAPSALEAPIKPATYKTWFRLTRAGNTEKISALLAENPELDINKGDSTNSTGLMLAAMGGKV